MHWNSIRQLQFKYQIYYLKDGQTASISTWDLFIPRMWLHPTCTSLDRQRFTSWSRKSWINPKEQLWILKKTHGIKLQYLRIIMPRFEANWIKNKGWIAHQNLTLIQIVIQKILNKSWRGTRSSLKTHSVKPDYPRNIVVKLQVDCKKTQREITHRFLDKENRKTRKNQTKLNNIRPDLLDI